MIGWFLSRFYLPESQKSIIIWEQLGNVRSFSKENEGNEERPEFCGYAELTMWHYAGSQMVFAMVWYYRGGKSVEGKGYDMI